MSVSKSDLIKQLKQIYPNILKKDLSKIFDVFIEEIMMALKNNERVELRGFGVFSTNIQKPRISRNPKTGDEKEITARNVISFYPSKAMKSKI